MSNSFLVAASGKSTPAMKALTLRDGVAYFESQIHDLLKHPEDLPLLEIACRRIAFNHHLTAKERDFEQSLNDLIKCEKTYQHMGEMYVKEESRIGVNPALVIDDFKESKREIIYGETTYDG